MAVGTSALEGVVNSTWHERTVLVTGATGLLGSWLVKSLVGSGARVVALIRDHDPQSELLRSGLVRRITVVDGRLESLADIERALAVNEVDTVFHLGAQTLVGPALHDPVGTLEVNVRGTWNLLEACRRQSALVQRVLVASSDKAYGGAPSLPYTEDTPLRGQHPYDVSKSCADLLAQSWFHTYGTPVVIARCGNIYGGGDLNWSRLVPGAIRSLLHGQRPIVRSDGTFLRDYVYVEDAVDAYLKMADSLATPGVAGQAFNFGPGKPETVLGVIASIAEQLGRGDLEPVVQDSARAEIRDQFLDATRAASVLGWQPKWSLKTGLAPTISWYRSFLGIL